MEEAIIYTALLWTAALLVIVHKIGMKKIKEARTRRALRFSILWPDGTRS
jgi:hypothetical protein